MNIYLAVTAGEVEACFELISELRPRLSLQEYLTSVKRMASTTGYQIAYLLDGNIKAVAGLRVSEWLHTGRYVEIEDLITRSCERSKGYGGTMFNWIKEYGVSHDCKQIRLVSGIRRVDAHRFYERQGMVFEAKYYSLDLSRN